MIIIGFFSTSLLKRQTDDHFPSADVYFYFTIALYLFLKNTYSLAEVLKLWGGRTAN